MADSQSIRSDFYVYVLVRDTGVPFYIGKGRGKRWGQHAIEARSGRRGYRQHIIRDMQARGVEMPKVKLHEGLTEAVAHEYEIALIAAIGRHPHGPLVNQTDGGEGASGHKATLETRAKQSAKRRGVPKSAEHVANQADARRGKRMSLEACANMKLAKRAHIPCAAAVMAAASANRGKKQSPETLAKRAATKLARGSDTLAAAKARGRKNSPAHVAKTAAAHRGMKRSAETCANISAAKLGKPIKRGRKMSPGHIAKTRRRPSRSVVTDCGASTLGPRQSLLDFGPPGY